MTTLGTFFVTVLVMLIGVFLLVAAYSRKPILLKIATFWLMDIDPDNPGRRQRAIMFTIGAALITVSLGLIVLQKLVELGLIGS